VANGEMAAPAATQHAELEELRQKIAALQVRNITNYWISAASGTLCRVQTDLGLQHG
jgi:hypothetical protein